MLPGVKGPTLDIAGERTRTRIIDGQVCMFVAYTTHCSGCAESDEGYFRGYPYDEKAGCVVGGGCHECGHTGKRRVREWVPIWPAEEARAA